MGKKSKTTAPVSSASVPSELFASIYAFLLDNGLEKTAKTFKKETKVEITQASSSSLLDVYNAGAQSLASTTNIGAKRKASDDEEETVAAEEEIQNDVETEEPKSKKQKKEAKKSKKDKKESKKSKKDKKDGDADAESSATATETKAEPTPTPAPTEVEAPKPNSARKTNVPFRRVKSETIVVPKEFQTNSYEGTFGADGWGAKASADMIVTRGKSFRHEKTKKKRGSYRGGTIDIHAINSTKTTFADWD